jgi:hypothetical protein
MTTLYTIEDNGEITSGLTAVEAAQILLTDDGADYEIRAGEECGGILKGERHYELWIRKQVANKSWTKTVISGIAATEEDAEVEISESVIKSGHWETGSLHCMTDASHAEMVAQLAADEPAAEERPETMSTRTITFTLSADSDAAELREEIGQNYGAWLDMIANKEFGEHTAEIGSEGTGDARIDVLYFPASDRAAIDDNGSTHWTDASSVEDAIRRYRNDEMAN